MLELSECSISTVFFPCKKSVDAQKGELQSSQVLYHFSPALLVIEVICIYTYMLCHGMLVSIHICI